VGLSGAACQNLHTRIWNFMFVLLSELVLRQLKKLKNCNKSIIFFVIMAIMGKTPNSFFLANSQNTPHEL
jgi:hypothetical protein